MSVFFRGRARTMGGMADPRMKGESGGDWFRLWLGEDGSRVFSMKREAAIYICSIIYDIYI